MKIFGYDFDVLEDSHVEDLLQLEREGAVYFDRWFDDLGDYRHVRIKLTPEEIREFVRSMWAFELFIRAGCPPKAALVPGIPADIATRADSYALNHLAGEHRRRDSAGSEPRDHKVHVKSDGPWHCAAGFMGNELEKLLCFDVPGRVVILEELGIESLLSTLRRAVDALTPSIRLFQQREKGLAQWTVTREDDIRDLLFAILRASISDINREEPVPSRAGTYRFVDLCTKTARLLIEIKWIDKKGSWRRLIKEINDDVQSYIPHPACQNLVFVVIDAVKDIPDPAQFEQELSGPQEINGKEIKIEVFVREP